MNNSKILSLVAGSSGGHILPAIQIGKKWLQKNPKGKIIFFCSKKNIDKKILNKTSFINHIIFLNLCNFPSKKIWLYPKFIFQFIIVFFKSLFYIFKYKPYKIIGTGGYISIPVCIAAKLIKSRIELYELNVVPGRAIKVLTKIANKIFITFEGSKFFLQNRVKNFAQRCELIDYPIRFKKQNKISDKQTIIKTMNKNFETTFFRDKKTIFLLGGSQGSIFLNRLLKKWIHKNKYLLTKIQIIHQTGIKDKTDWNSFYKNLEIPSIIFSYDENIKNYYLISDLIICRAGAGTLFEIEFFKKQSLVIPLKSKQTDHQVDNALEMQYKNPNLFTLQDQNLITKNFNLFSDEIIKILNL
ncbi:UDP-N-acetylglucosamine--N-acetylmuramyl-(pentapeptide) pyrophosphoryl-undecaprenol N-acetylglucosamine transferase [Candidatus Babeliales bacterium]|nr:UDP-N-acetylglucosamine--N-acetylmuramyl-(pentapeptide) pyrophosphoryl-undecaprenol N-acetylglucosamine transferase [Candidatus Babeliales bacterium]